MTSFPTYDSRGHTLTEKRPWVKRESTTMTQSHSSLVEESDETMQLIVMPRFLVMNELFPKQTSVKSFCDRCGIRICCVLVTRVLQSHKIEGRS